MTSVEKAIEKVENMMQVLETSVTDKSKIPALRVDPDDPWAEAINPPAGVYKERCPITGYLLTMPFEANCPMPEAFKNNSNWLDGMLAPVIKPKGDKAKPAAAAPAPKKAEQPKPAAAAAAPATPPVASGGPAALTPAGLEAFGKAKLAVGKVQSAEFVEGSDKLYICKVEVGAGEVRQVITGLRKFVPQNELQGRSVVVILNLKPAKLAGHASEAMILASEQPAPESPEGKIVKLLTPPAGAAPGSRVFMAGGAPVDAPPKECKSAAWATVKEGLRVQGGKATFGGTVLVTAEGEVAAEAADGSLIG